MPREEELERRYERLTDLSRRVCGDVPPDDREDLVSRVWESVRGFNETTDSFLGEKLARARLTYWRDRLRNPGVSLSDLVESCEPFFTDPDPFELARMDWLQRCVQDLPADCREAIRRKYFEGQPGGQVSTACLETLRRAYVAGFDRLWGDPGG